MDFTTLVQEVTANTRRPDMQSQIESAVKAATTKAHTLDFFYQDIVESGVQFLTADFIQNFNPREIFPRFRKVKYLRNWCYDPTSLSHGAPGKFFEWIQIENAIDGYGYNKTDVAYMAGQLIQIRSSSHISHILFGAYLFPDIANTNNLEATSFIAREYPYAIIYEAMRRIYKQIGNDSQATEMTNLRNEEYQILTINNGYTPGE